MGVGSDLDLARLIRPDDHMVCGASCTLATSATVGAAGTGLARDAVLRTLQAADIAGIRAVLVHAKDENARSFYERSGFLPSPIDPLTLMLPLKDARAALRGA